MSFWLVKTEPSTYSWDDLVRDGRTAWTGVRNFGARNHLAAMRVGDLAFVYHSGEEKAIVGVAEVVGEAVPDATAGEGAWVSVELAARKPVVPRVRLKEIKANPLLSKMVLVNNSRLSVQPVDKAEWKECLKING